MFVRSIPVINMRVALVLILASMTGPALGAVNKDGGKPSVNPCAERRDSCVGEDPQRVAADEPHGTTEPMVIFLDADGNTLSRMPISRFREKQPDAKLPPELDRLP